MPVSQRILGSSNEDITPKDSKPGTPTSPELSPNNSVHFTPPAATQQLSQPSQQDIPIAQRRFSQNIKPKKEISQRKVTEKDGKTKSSVGSKAIDKQGTSTTVIVDENKPNSLATKSGVTKSLPSVPSVPSETLAIGRGTSTAHPISLEEAVINRQIQINSEKNIGSSESLSERNVAKGGLEDYVKPVSSGEGVVTHKEVYIDEEAEQRSRSRENSDPSTVQSNFSPSNRNPLPKPDNQDWTTQRGRGKGPTNK